MDRIVELGWPVTQAAESVGVSRQTAYRWLKRFEEEGRGRTGGSFLPASPQSGSGFFVEVEGQIVADRIREREGPHLMAGTAGRTALDHLRGARPPGSVPPLRLGPDHRNTDPLCAGLPR